MMKQILAWLAANIAVVSAAGAVFVFLLYDRRQKSLEIRKLKLEIEAAERSKRDALIYIPDLKEMRDVLSELKQRGKTMYAARSERSMFDEFIASLTSALVDTLSHFDGNIATEKQFLEAFDPRTKVGSKEGFPHFSELHKQWENVKAFGHGVSPESMRKIDLFLTRSAKVEAK